MRLKPLLLLCLLPATPAVAAPVTLVNETFDTSQPTQLQYFGFSGSVPTVNEEGKLRVPYASSGRFATSNFTRTSLNIGDQLSVKFDLSGSRTNGTDVVDFLIGFYDSRDTRPIDNSTTSRNAAADDGGYVVTLRDDPGQFFAGTTRSDFVPDTLVGEVGGFNGTYTIANGANHTVEIVYRILRANSSAIDIYFDGVYRATTNHSSSLRDVDNLQFGFGNRTFNNVKLDNLTVTYLPIPEPAHLTYSLPLLALLRRPIRANSSSLRDDTPNCR